MTIQIIHPSDRDEWLALRQVDVTASVASTLLGSHPYTTPYQLWAEKTGRVQPDQEETEAMERGNLLEPVAVAMVRKRHPEWEVFYEGDVKTYYRDPDHHIGATPDAAVIIPGRPGRGNMQIKTAAETAYREQWFDRDTGETIPPTWIAVQAIVEAKLTNCDYALVAVLVMTWSGALRLHVVDIPLHHRLWDRFVEKAREFWSLVRSGGQPPIDWDRDGRTVLDVYQSSYQDRRDLSGDAELDTLVARYKLLKDEEREARRKAEVLKPQIIYALGNSEAGFTAGWNIVARTQDRDEYRVRSATTRALRINPRKPDNAAHF